MYKVRLTGQAKRELKNISKLHLQALSSIFEELKDDPFLGKSLTRELTGGFSLRMGVYRVIYKVSKKDKIIVVLAAEANPPSRWI